MDLELEIDTCNSSSHSDYQPDNTKLDESTCAEERCHEDERDK